MIKWGILVWCALIASGCAANFQETHYFKIHDKEGKTTNYMRLRITGNAQFTSAKYASGYYDQAALDKFFNTTSAKNVGTQQAVPNGNDQKPAKKSDDSSSNQSNTAGQSDQTITPVGNKGVLTLVLSTDASAILSVIGAFAENEIVANAMVNMVSGQSLKEVSETEIEFKETASLSKSLINELNTLMGKFPAEPKTVEDAEIALKNILSALSRASGGPAKINDFKEAAVWIETIKE